MNWFVNISGVFTVMLASFAYCMIDTNVKIHAIAQKLHGSNIAPVPGKTHYCDQYFFGSYFPRMKQNQSGLVRLCQTQQHPGSEGSAVYATLYSTLDRIPIYSAATVQLYPNSTGFSRPDERLWNRVSLALCDANSIGLDPLTLSSRIGHDGGAHLKRCGMWQALNSDYIGNKQKIGVDRGHLNPNAINCQDQESQIGTFTLTNAAPQYSMFNENAWRQYECMTEYVIFKYVPTERVHIFTGTWGVAKDAHGQPLWMNSDSPDKNPVKIPGYYWKAVCYPGNEWQQKKPWGYAVMRPNVNSDTQSQPDSFMKLNQFSSTYFMDNLFDNSCLTAELGPIENLFGVWDEALRYHCGSDPTIVCNR